MKYRQVLDVPDTSLPVRVTVLNRISFVLPSRSVVVYQWGQSVWASGFRQVDVLPKEFMAQPSAAIRLSALPRWQHWIFLNRRISLRVLQNWAHMPWSACVKYTRRLFAKYAAVA